MQFERFRQEALALSRLRSRHIARVYDFGKDDAVGLYLVMELIEGVPLDVRSLGRPLLPHEILRVARGLLAGLAEAHAHGIVHRDIKPSNVLLPRGRGALDEVRVLDFGIARDERRARVLAEALGQERDAQGIVLGTPAYMAPEQLRHGTSGPASDVYAAGLVLFELLGAGLLFPGETSLREQLDGAAHRRPTSLEGRVPPPLGSLLARMLAREPSQRFRDAGEALEAIGDLETAPVTIAELFATRRTSPKRPRRRRAPRGKTLSAVASVPAPRAPATRRSASSAPARRVGPRPPVSSASARRNPPAAVAIGRARRSPSA